MHSNILLRFFSTVTILCFPQNSIQTFPFTTFSKHISLLERDREVINFALSIRINIIADYNHFSVIISKKSWNTKIILATS